MRICARPCIPVWGLFLSWFKDSTVHSYNAFPVDCLYWATPHYSLWLIGCEEWAGHCEWGSVGGQCERGTAGRALWAGRCEWGSVGGALWAGQCWRGTVGGVYSSVHWHCHSFLVTMLASNCSTICSYYSLKICTAYYKHSSAIMKRYNKIGTAQVAVYMPLQPFVSQLLYNYFVVMFFIKTSITSSQTNHWLCFVSPAVSQLAYFFI